MAQLTKCALFVRFCLLLATSAIVTCATQPNTAAKPGERRSARLYDRPGIVFDACSSNGYQVRVTLGYPKALESWSWGDGKPFVSMESVMLPLMRAIPQIKQAYCERLQERAILRGTVALRIRANLNGIQSVEVAESHLKDTAFELQLANIVKAMKPAQPEPGRSRLFEMPINFFYQVDFQQQSDSLNERPIMVRDWTPDPSMCDSANVNVVVICGNPVRSCAGALCYTEPVRQWLLKGVGDLKTLYCARLLQRPEIRGRVVLRTFLSYGELLRCELLKSDLDDNMLEDEILILMRGIEFKPHRPNDTGICTVDLPITFDREGRLPGLPAYSDTLRTSPRLNE